MDDQEIPRNLKCDFCDNPTVSPIEFNRNSSLIDNKTRALNISFEKLAEEDDKCMSINTSSNQFFRINNEKLDLKFIGEVDEENSLSFEMEEFNHDFSFDDEEFRSYYQESPFFQKKKEFYNNVIEDDSIELMDGENLDLGTWTPKQTDPNSFQLKEQKIIYKEAKQRNHGKCSINDSVSRDMTDEEHDLLFDSFSINEGIILSPIAHEMSQINGRELKDVSNFFSCDISQI